MDSMGFKRIFKPLLVLTTHQFTSNGLLKAHLTEVLLSICLNSPVKKESCMQSDFHCLTYCKPSCILKLYPAHAIVKYSIVSSAVSLLYLPSGWAGGGSHGAPWQRQRRLQQSARPVATAAANSVCFKWFCSN